MYHTPKYLWPTCDDITHILKICINNKNTNKHTHIHIHIYTNIYNHTSIHTYTSIHKYNLKVYKYTNIIQFTDSDDVIDLVPNFI